MKSKVILLEKRPAGMAELTDFSLAEEDVRDIRSGELLLETQYVSVDPYLRAKMAGHKHPSFEVGQPLASKIIAKVVESKKENFLPGDTVSYYLDWKTLQISDGNGLVKIDPKAAPETTYLGIFGVTGLSAYFALRDIGQPKTGETLVISGAAGAVGTIAGQIGKLWGCRVVGIAGTDEKVNIIKSRFGFDEAINYREASDLRAAIAEACPNGVDIYFDNVGGTTSDAVLQCINTYGRVIACGSIANYNDQEPILSPCLLPLVVYKFLTIKGFLIGDYATQFSDGLKQLAEWLSTGKLDYAETVIEGFEQLPKAFIGLFEGINTGKLIVKV